MTQRAETASPGRSYNQPCLIAQALDVLGDRWTLIILRDLMTGLEHFNDILENCDGLSPNVLSSRLKRLDAEGLVERHYHRDLPPRVTYNLTEKGWAVRPVLVSLIQWSGTYGQRISPDAVGSDVSADFVARVIPAFAFDPECAAGVNAAIRIELTDCDECRDWTLVICDGRLLPQRDFVGEANVHLKTTVEGLFQFLRGQAPPADCGEVVGDEALANAVQACFRY